MARTRRRKGEGTLTRRKDGRYEGRLSLGTRDGKRVRKSIYGASATAVLSRMRDLQVAQQFNVSIVRVREYFSQWLKDGRSRWEPQTYRTYRSIIGNHIAPYIGDSKIIDVVPADVRLWMRELEAAYVGASTRRRLLAILKSGFKSLVDEWHLQRNPCDPIRGPKVRRKPFYVPSPRDIRKLIESTEEDWLLALVLLAFTCTLRQGEIFALHWDQLDLGDASVLVDKSLAENWSGKLERKAPKNKYSVRKLFFPEVTKLALRQLKKNQLRSGYKGAWVFGGLLRKSNFVRRIWRPLLDRARLPYFKFHAARHAGNSLLIAQGADAVSIARRMGHADTRMTFDLYGHLFEGSGRAMAAKMQLGLKMVGIDRQMLLRRLAKVRSK